MRYVYIRTYRSVYKNNHKYVYYIYTHIHLFIDFLFIHWFVFVFYCMFFMFVSYGLSNTKWNINDLRTTKTHGLAAPESWIMVGKPSIYPLGLPRCTWKYKRNSSGWWFGTWILFFSWNFIIPTDFQFFRGVGRPPTR